MIRNGFILFFCIMTACPILCFADTVNYYRYKDKEGHTVLGNSLPPEIVKQGYEIVSPNGVVIEKIPPQKTQEEIAKDLNKLQQESDAKKQEALQEQKNKEQARQDDILLRSFTTEDDIARLRDEKISSMAVLEEIVKDNLSRLNKQLDEEKSTALSYTQTGNAVPENLAKSIEVTERQIKDNLGFLDRKKAEKEKIKTKYQHMIDRFKILKTKHENVQ